MEGDFRIGDRTVVPTLNQILRGGTAVHVEPKVMRVLLHLAARRGEVARREALIHEVWPDTFVTDDVLKRCISDLRKALGDDHQEPRFIETIPKVGYRLLTSVEPVEPQGLIAPVGDDDSAGVEAVVKPRTATKAFARWLVIAAGVGGLLLIGGLLLLRPFQARSTSDPAAALTRLTADSGLTMQPTLSADGEILAYASDRAGNGDLDIWMQRLDGGEPVRLTDGPMDEDSPALSPDGTRVVFRSARDGGGLYVMSASSDGEPRFIASGGFTPRFSPDGRWIAYSIGYDASLREGDPYSMTLNRIFIVPAEGGTPRRIAPEFGSAFGPIWSPDGRHLLFWATRSIQELGDWWVIPVLNGAAVKTGLRDALKRHEIGNATVGVWRERNRLLLSGSLFSATYPTHDIWEWELDLESWRASDTGRRLTTSTSAYVHPSAVGDRLVVTARAGAADLWTLPMQPNDGTVTGPARRLTQTAHLKGSPSVSADGLIVAYYTPQPRGNEIWTLNTATGDHSRIVPPADVSGPVLRLDGARVAYTRNFPSSPPLIEAVPAEGGPAERLCGCGWVGVGEWSPDGRWMLLADDKDTAGRLYVTALDVRTGTTVPFLQHPRHPLYQTHFSSDGRWVVFMAVVEGFKRSRLWAAPFRNAMVPPEEWVALTDGESWDDKPRWSPDGGIFYFVSWRDGFPCIWGRRVDRETKEPIGEPFDVYHSHNARLAIRNIPPNYQEISVGRDRIILNMGEMTGNIWSLPLGSGAK